MMRVMRAVSGTLLDGRQMAPSRAFSKVDLPAYSMKLCDDYDVVLNNVSTELRASYMECPVHSCVYLGTGPTYRRSLVASLHQIASCQSDLACIALLF